MVHECQRVLRRYSDRATARALCDAGLLDQPTGRELDLAVARRIAGDFVRSADESFAKRLLHDSFDFRGGDDRVQEEGARAPAIWVVGIEDHGFAATEVENGAADVGKRRVRSDALRKLWVANRSRAIRAQGEANRADDEAMRRALEEAVAIAEGAILRASLFEGQGIAAEDADAGDRRSNVLTVRTHVLNRCCARRSGDPGQAFEAGPVTQHRTVDDGFPGHSSACGHRAPIAKLDLGDPHVDDETVIAFVRHDEVRAAAQYRGGDVLIRGPSKRIRQAGLVVGPHEMLRGPAELQRRERGERNVTLDVECRHQR